jgi:ribA/ribD-fused uncharacterized protein
METADYRSLCETWAAGHRPGFRFFWRLPQREMKELGDWIFSQWYRAPFTVKGITYATAEHWMMSAKARVFQDHDTLTKITEDSLRERPSPDQMKQLGRAVKGFDPDVWDRYKFDIVVNGNMLKFGQNFELRDYLLATGDAVIVEASPYDKVWGNGLAEDHSEARDPTKWKGENLLGFALMKVRQRLRTQSSRPR